MAQSNLERVGRALELLNKGLKPFVEREMLAKYGVRWQYEAVNALRDQHLTDDGQDIHLDTQALLLILWDQWHTVFQNVLGHAERSLVSELPIPTAIPPAAQPTQPQQPKYHRFYGSVTIDERRMATAAGSIMEEVVKHLTSLVGVKVKVTLEIQAELPDGAPETTVRTVMENCRTLKFESFEFEDE